MTGSAALARTLLAVIAALVTVTVRASGVPDHPECDRELGPIYGTFGDLGPIDRSDIALLAEHLTIVLGVRSGPAWSLTTEGWSARAEYRLFNPGPSAEVRFGVPLAWDQYAVGSPFGRATSDPDDERSAEALLGASAIRLSIGGKTVRCELSWNATLSPYAVAAGLENAFEGKCVAPLTIPSGESTLVLEYPAEFSLLAWQDSVRLRYALWPAGSWRGPVRELFVTVELGDQAPLAKVVSPPGAVLRDGRVEWKLRNVDLKRAGAIVIDLPPRELGRDGWIRLDWGGAGWVRVDAPVEVVASSTLPPQGRARYTASLVLDGDRGTSWCEGADGDGAAQSLSFSFRLPPELAGSACAVRDVTLVRGHARTAKTWSENGRVTAVRIESCSRPEDGFDVNLAPSTHSDEPNIRPKVARDSFDAAIQEVFFPPGILESERDCVRFVIRAVAPGAKYHDTCISELVPRVYCRKAGASSSTTPGGDRP